MLLKRGAVALLAVRSPFDPVYPVGQVSSYVAPIAPPQSEAPRFVKTNSVKANHERVMGRFTSTTYLVSSSSVHRPKTKKNKKKTPLLTWEEKFALLRAFKRIFGHCSVPRHFVVHGVNLYGWVDTQRKEFSKYRRGEHTDIINEKRVARLSRVGMEWIPLVKKLGATKGTLGVFNRSFNPKSSLALLSPL